MQRNARTTRASVFSADMVWITVALCVSSISQTGVAGIAVAESIRMYAPLHVTAMTIWALLFLKGHDGFRRGWKVSKLLAEVIVGVSVVCVGLSAVAFLVHDPVPRRLIAVYSLLLAAGFTTIRGGMHCVLRVFGSGARRKVVIVGHGAVSTELAARLETHPELRCEVVGFLCPPDSGAEPSGSSHLEEGVQQSKVMGFLSARKVTDVIIGPAAQKSTQAVLDLATMCRQDGIRVSLVPQTYDLYDARPSLLNLDGLPVLCLEAMPLDDFGRFVKRTLDVILALAFAPIAVPFIAVGAVYSRLMTKAAFSRERRSGQFGRPFTLYRLNIRRNLSSERTPNILALLSITELPQLWNVLLGDMSLVGPRPESVERAKTYSDWQKQRLAVRPGITGLAQVHGIREQHSTEDKARFDLEYIVSWTPLSDCMLLVETLWTLVMRIVSPSKPSIKGEISLGAENRC